MTTTLKNDAIQNCKRYATMILLPRTANNHSGRFLHEENRIMPDNTKTFYFFNCLLDGAHIRTLWQAAFCFAETQVSILFVQVIFCLEVDPVSLYRKRKCIIVHSTIFAFQPECHSSIPKICKVGLVCCFCISAASFFS